MLTNQLSETELDVIANALTYEIASYDREEQTDSEAQLTERIRKILSSSLLSEPQNLPFYSSYLRTMLNNYTIHLLHDFKSAKSESEQERLRIMMYCCSYLISEM